MTFKKRKNFVVVFRDKAFGVSHPESFRDGVAFRFPTALRPETMLLCEVVRYVARARGYGPHDEPLEWRSS